MNEEMTNNDETYETLWHIRTDIGFASRNLERIMVQYRNGKFLHPPKIEAVTFHLNRASYYLREKITSLLPEEDRDW